MKMMFQTLVDCGIELGSILGKSASDEEIIEIKISWIGTVQM
jgi:hypothetical protein